MRVQLMMLGTICALCAGCSEEGIPKRLRSGVQFDIHRVVDEAGPNTKELADPVTGDLLQLETPPVIAAENVTSARVVAGDTGHVRFEVSVDGEGATKLKAATAEVGDRLAVVVDGKIVTAPVINSTVSSAFSIEGAYTREDWEALLE